MVATRSQIIQQRQEQARREAQMAKPRCRKCKRNHDVAKAKAVAVQMYQDPEAKKVLAGLGEEHGKFWEVMCGVCIRDYVQTRNRPIYSRCKECGKTFSTADNISTLSDYARDSFVVEEVIQPLAQQYGTAVRFWERICTPCFRHLVERAYEDAEGFTVDEELEDYEA